MKRVLNVVVINDNQFDDDVVHVFSLLEADSLSESCETSQNEHLSDHFFLNLSHMRFSFKLDVNLHVQNSYRDRELLDDLFYVDNDRHVKKSVIANQMKQLILDQRETCVVSTYSLLAHDVCLFQCFAIVCRIRVVD